MSFSFSSCLSCFGGIAFVYYGVLSRTLQCPRKSKKKSKKAKKQRSRGRQRPPAGSGLLLVQPTPHHRYQISALLYTASGAQVHVPECFCRIFAFILDRRRIRLIMMMCTIFSLILGMSPMPGWALVLTKF
jgi:hypothetical protein